MVRVIWNLRPSVRQFYNNSLNRVKSIRACFKICRKDWGFCSKLDFLYKRFLVKQPIVFNRFEIKFDRFLYVGQSLLLGISFAYTAGKRWYINRKTTLIARFENHFQTQGDFSVIVCMNKLRLIAVHVKLFTFKTEQLRTVSEEVLERYFPPCIFPSSQARFSANVLIVLTPSSSCITSPFPRPKAMFQ